MGYLGSLDNWDELLPLVNAFTQMHRKHPETRLLVEGDGPAKTQMITELSRRGLLGTACFLGRVSQRRIAGVLGAIDVAVAPGRSSAIRLQEIMLAGIPLLCCAQNEPALRHNVTAFCYQPGNPESLVQAMLTLYSDRILRMRLGSSARREVFREQNWDLIALSILNTIKPRLQPDLALPELAATSLQDSPRAAL